MRGQRQRRAGIRARQADPLAGEAIERRGQASGAAEGADPIGAERVDGDQQDVAAVAVRAGQRRRAKHDPPRGARRDDDDRGGQRSARLPAVSGSRGARSRPIAVTTPPARRVPILRLDAGPPVDAYSTTTSVVRRRCRRVERDRVAARRENPIVAPARLVDEPLQHFLQPERRFRRAIGREIPPPAHVVEPAARAR